MPPKLDPGFVAWLEDAGISEEEFISGSMKEKRELRTEYDKSVAEKKRARDDTEDDIDGERNAKRVKVEPPAPVAPVVSPPAPVAPVVPPPPQAPVTPFVPPPQPPKVTNDPLG